MNTTIPQSGVADFESAERLFFLRMAYAIAATVVIGFGGFAALGISSFSSPWWVHLHAVSFMAWIALYITQNTLAYRGELQHHRRLGRVGALLAGWMVIMGLVLTPFTVSVGRVPPVFTPAYFLALDWVNIVCFAALVFTALHLRRETDWHRRLMFCATVCVIAPAVGRLQIIAMNQMSSWVVVGSLLSFVAVGMLADLKRHHRIHPAYGWGAAAIFVMAPLIDGLPATTLFQHLALQLAGAPQP